MLFSPEGIKPDPEKVTALEDLKPPKNKEELKSFICMMQSNSNFISYFLKSVAPLKILLNKEAHFKRTMFHQNVFHKLLKEFRKETLLTYFDINKQTFIFMDAHKTGLTSILALDEKISNAKSVPIISRSTSKAEQNHRYLIGPPHENPLPQTICPF